MLKNIKFLSAVVLILYAANASAEVMDKQTTLIENLSWGFLAGILWYLSARYKPWLLVLLVPIPLLHFVGLINTINSPDIGRYILIEAGPSYIYVVYGSALFMCVGVVLGSMMRWKALKSKVTSKIT